MTTQTKTKVSVCAVNYHADDFMDLLRRSVQMKKSGVHEIEIMIHENSNGENIGHAAGMDKLINDATGEFILALDIDAFVLLQNWDQKLVDFYRLGNNHRYNDKLRLIAAEGGMLKPVRPCVMFFERDFFLENKMSFKAQELNGVKFDVGIHFYFMTLTLGFRVALLKYAKTRYNGVMGNEYDLAGARAFYHNWYATRWFNPKGERVHDEIDGVSWEKFSEAKRVLFSQVTF